MGAELSPLLNQIARVLDRPRRDLLFLFGPFIQPFLKNRSLRVHLSACVFLCLAFGVSIGLPCWQLALGPIVLGIPHIIGDIRYLVLQEKLHINPTFWLLVILPLLAFLILQKSVYGAVAIFGATLLQQSNYKTVLVSLGALCIAVLAFFYHRIFLYSLLHLHNVIAIIIWWFSRKNRHSWEIFSLMLCGFFSLLILTGSNFILDSHPNQLPLQYFTRTLAPFASGEWAVRVVLLYAFLQSFHYFIWVRLIPEDNRKQPTPQSFRKSLSTLQQDFGEKGVFLIGLSMLGLLIWAGFDMKSARANYLYFISFHGFLELAVCAYYLCRRNS